MKLYTLRSFVVGILLVVLGGVIGFQLGTGKNVPGVTRVLQAIPQFSRVINVKVPQDKSNVDFSQFWVVWQRLEGSYLDPQKLNAKKMVYGAIQGMVASLGDPYTLYLPPEDQKRNTESLQGSFDGVGIELGYKNQALSVVAPIKDHPAAKAGIRAGDFILHIKDEQKKIDKDTSGITLPEAVDLIRGVKGTKVTLTILHEGGKPEAIDLIRDTIVVPSVELKFVDKGNKKVAEITLSQFGDRTDTEWNTAVDQIVAQKKNLAGVVLDLRNNPGGYLQEAINIGSEFISSGVIVTQQGKNESQSYTVNRQGRLIDIPVVVLVNKGSASASEIVAGALRDRRGVKVVGENSFGKGTVQDAQNDLPGGAGLHITIARWLLPSGNWIHEKGLAPDVQVTDDLDTKDVDEALQKAVETL
ncbi:MAG: S41 family peptidase [Patescibacteria group bacterium]